MTNAEKDPRQYLLEELARCGPWLQAAMDHAGGTTHTLGDLYNGILSGHLRLWPAEDAVIVTEFVHYPRERHIHVFLAGGNLKTIEAMRPEIEHFGIANGCSRLTISGRPGWARHFKEQGYETTLHTVVKRLDIGIVPSKGAGENT